MNTQDAALQLARSLPGGIEALAVRMGKSAHSLRHELTGSGTAKLGLLDAETIGLYAQQMRAPNALAILNAMAANHNALALPLPEGVALGDDTFKGLADAAREFSEFIASVADAAADGQVTGNELALVDRELGDLIARAQGIRQQLAVMHEAAKPQALKVAG